MDRGNLPKADIISRENLYFLQLRIKSVWLFFGDYTKYDDSFAGTLLALDFINVRLVKNRL